jgi:hypothetical protein
MDTRSWEQTEQPDALSHSKTPKSEIIDNDSVCTNRAIKEMQWTMTCGSWREEGVKVILYQVPRRFYVVIGWTPREEWCAEW